MKKIIFTQPNGVLAIVIPAQKSDLERLFGPMSDQEYESHVWERSIPESAINPRWVSASVVDAVWHDHSFRDAWIDGGAKAGIAVDMPKAREIHMGRIRAARNKALQALDVDQLRGLDVSEKKQSLRDLPQTINLEVAETPDDLKAIWPDDLK